MKILKFSKIEFYKEMKAANQLKKIKSTLVILSALSVLLVGFDVLEFSVEWIQERFKIISKILIYKRIYS